MRFKVIRIKPKEDRTSDDKITEHYVRFTQSLADYPLNPKRTVVVMDGATYHRVKRAREAFTLLGVSIFILPASSKFATRIRNLASYHIENRASARFYIDPIHKHFYLPVNLEM